MKSLFSHVDRNEIKLLFFFFSSRRRHTRLQGDWSSDVCSSDLPDNERLRLVEHLRRIGCTVETQWPVPDGWTANCDLMLLAVEHELRNDIQRLQIGRASCRERV